MQVVNMSACIQSQISAISTQSGFYKGHMGINQFRWYQMSMVHAIQLLTLNSSFIKAELCHITVGIQHVLEFKKESLI